MAQIPGLGLDQSQLADVINQQYKGYSQKQRNQMMQSAAATPDNWSAITNKSNATATQPTEYLGSGRTDNVPAVSFKGEGLTGYDSSNLSSLYNMNSAYKDASFDYTDSAGKGYFLPETQNKIEAHGPNYVSGTPAASYASNFQDPRAMSDGGYYFSDPWGFSHSLSKVGNNQYFVSEDTLNENTKSGTADTWYGLNKNADLSGLRYGQYNGQSGLFFDPNKTDLSSLLTKGRNNSAYAEKKSGGFGGIAGNIMKWTDPGAYYAHGGQDYFDKVDNEGLYSAVFDRLDPILDKVDPLHNTGQDLIAGAVGADSQKEAFNTVAPTLVNMFVPYGAGYLINAANSANQGDTTGAVTNLASYGASYLGQPTAGAGGASSGMFNSGTSLGSVALDKAAQNFIVNSAINTAANGGDIGNAMKSAAFSTASGAAGNWLGNTLQGSLGEIASKALGGAASGGLNSLFSKNSPVNGSLFGAMSGGLHGFLNSTDRSNNTFSKDSNLKNRQTAQNLTKLAKLFVKK